MHTFPFFRSITLRNEAPRDFSSPKLGYRNSGCSKTYFVQACRTKLSCLPLLQSRDIAVDGIRLANSLIKASSPIPGLRREGGLVPPVQVPRPPRSLHPLPAGERQGQDADDHDGLQGPGLDPIRRSPDGGGPGRVLGLLLLVI